MASITKISFSAHLFLWNLIALWLKFLLIFPTPGVCTVQQILNYFRIRTNDKEHRKIPNWFGKLQNIDSMKESSSGKRTWVVREQDLNLQTEYRGSPLSMCVSSQLIHWGLGREKRKVSLPPPELWSLSPSLAHEAPGFQDFWPESRTYRTGSSDSQTFTLGLELYQFFSAASLHILDHVVCFCLQNHMSQFLL